jgi:hypothetical protein
MVNMQMNVVIGLARSPIGGSNGMIIQCQMNVASILRGGQRGTGVCGCASERLVVLSSWDELKGRHYTETWLTGKQGTKGTETE